MQSLSDILTDLFTNAAPCGICGKRVHTYHDQEKGSHYCFPCLEAAVEEAEAEMRAERLDMVLIACHSRQLAA